MDRDQPQLLIVSGRRNCDAPLRELSARRNIAVLNAPGVFDYAGVRGILRCDSLLLEPVGSMHCFSGSFVRAETLLRAGPNACILSFFRTRRSTLSCGCANSWKMRSARRCQ